MFKRYALIVSIFSVLFRAASLGTQADTNSPYNANSQTGSLGQPTQPAGLAAENTGFMGNDTLTGDWNGLRPQLAQKGFALSLVYIGEVFGNWGGAKQGVISDGLFNLTLDVDLERVTGFWKDAQFHANALYLYGPGLSARDVGDFSNTSNIAGYNTFRLQELWLQQSFWMKRASLRVGLLAADSEFFVSQASSLFINGTLGAFNLLATNFTNPPVYPLASPGIRLDVAPVSAFDFKAALFGISNSSDPTTNNRHGTYFDIDDGVLLAFEASYLVNQSPNDRGLVGSYKLGGFIHHGDYPTFRSQAEDALDMGSLSGHATNYAVYGVVDQEVYKHDEQVVEIFGRGGFAPSRYSFVSGYFDAGFNFTGFIPTRPDDIAGVAVAYSSVSDDFSAAEQLEGEPPSTSETVIEATYKINISKWWNIQPDMQYIVNPSGVVGSKDAFVIGVRTTITF